MRSDLAGCLTNPEKYQVAINPYHHTRDRYITEIKDIGDHVEHRGTTSELM